jgi:radical SAM superfamily enzyme YgiQ (UPF0313 family)
VTAGGGSAGLPRRPGVIATGSRSRILLIDPPSEVNLNLPNLAIAFAAAHLDARVVDLHALPWPRHRYLSAAGEQVVISVRPYTLRASNAIRERIESRRPGLLVQSLSGVVDVQCCYPFIQPWNAFPVDLPFGDGLPIPEYERFDSFNYLRTNWSTGFWAYTILTSLGCPHGCSYCAARQRRWHPRSPAHCVEELARAKRDYGIRSFEIVDDLFNMNEPRALEFCERVAPLGLSWSCANGIRADRFSEAQAKAMGMAGCTQVGFGIESVSPAVLQESRKGESLEQIESAVGWARKHIPEVCGFFIVGLPGATRETDLASVEWARKHGVRAYFSHFVPAPADAGAVFYGSASTAVSPSYPLEEQRQVYEIARRAIRTSYVERGVVRRVVATTLRGLPRYDWRSRGNHLRHLALRGWRMLRSGDIQ